MLSFSVKSKFYVLISCVFHMIMNEYTLKESWYLKYKLMKT